jgi:hypothetical protein
MNSVSFWQWPRAIKISPPDAIFQNHILFQLSSVVDFSSLEMMIRLYCRSIVHRNIWVSSFDVLRYATFSKSKLSTLPSHANWRAFDKSSLPVFILSRSNNIHFIWFDLLSDHERDFEWNNHQQILSKYYKIISILHHSYTPSSSYYMIFWKKK